MKRYVKFTKMMLYFCTCVNGASWSDVNDFLEDSQSQPEKKGKIYIWKYESSTSMHSVLQNKPNLQA